jgi:hypothetical protein
MHRAGVLRTGLRGSGRCRRRRLLSGVMRSVVVMVLRRSLIHRLNLGGN